MLPPPRLQASSSVVCSQFSGTGPTSASPPIPQLLQIVGNRLIQPVGLGLLLAQRCGETRHLVLEWLAVGFLRFGTDVPARREHVAVLADIVKRGGFAEARDVFILTGVLLAAPGMI